MTRPYTLIYAVSTAVFLLALCLAARASYVGDTRSGVLAVVAAVLLSWSLTGAWWRLVVRERAGR